MREGVERDRHTPPQLFERAAADLLAQAERRVRHLADVPQHGPAQLGEGFFELRLPVENTIACARDALDLVLHTVVPATGGTPTVENLGLAAGILGVLDERFLLLAVEESQQDLSGDGDKSDRVLFILDLDTGELESLRVAVVADGSLQGTRYAGHAPVLVPEVDNRATVRNGDGDLDDTFLYLVQSGG